MLTDAMGREIHVGDTLAYAVRECNSGVLKVGVVESIHAYEADKYDQELRKTIKVTRFEAKVRCMAHSYRSKVGPELMATKLSTWNDETKMILVK